MERKECEDSGCKLLYDDLFRDNSIYLELYVHQ